MLRRAISLLAAAALLGSMAPAEAAMVNFVLKGEITYAEAENSFLLAVGDTVSLEGTFDDSGLTGTGVETIKFDETTSNTFTLYLGVATANNTQDPLYGSDSNDPPLIEQTDGVVSGVYFDLYDGVKGALFEFGTMPLNPLRFNAGSEGIVEDQIQIQGLWGNWEADSDGDGNGNGSVPEPATVTLFGLGLMGLGVLRWKKQLA